jgi:hypothetical protein
MRKGSWSIGPADAAADLAVTVFPGDVGGRVANFNRWRQQSWWKAPLIGSLVASVVDTAVFFSLAFAGTELNWLTLAAGSYDRTKDYFLVARDAKTKAEAWRAPLRIDLAFSNDF